MRIDPEGIVAKACDNLKRWLSDYQAGSSDLLDGRMMMMEPLMQRTEMVKETAFDGALIPRLERFENHLRSQRHINYNPQPLRELLARLK